MKTPLLFDLDGTITDPAPGFLASMDYALEKMGEPLRPHEELTPFIGPPLRGSFEILLGDSDPVRCEAALEHYRDRLNDGGKFEATIYPGMIDLLASLTDDYRLFIATGKPRGVAREIATHFGFDHFFEEIYGAELDGRFGDKAELIAHFSEIHDLPKGHGAMIGDTTFDMRAGRLNHLDCLGVTWGYGTDEQLRESGAGELVSSSGELRAAIRKRYPTAAFPDS
ncbi:MAG: HAD hydrolase-like protein [Verrucomicrobiales bacterium]|nr:HAD hydrolase-like protein [Verrucomicrobiales bacterium]